MGKACINGTCRPASECPAGYGVINGICSKYYIDCPPNSRPYGSGDCSCNDGYYPTDWESYLTSDGSASSSMTNRVAQCSPCPPNSTGKNGSCSCNMGYAAIDRKVSWKAAKGGGSTETSILSSCQPCSNEIPDNATRTTSSCTSIKCDDGYYATAYRKYKYPDSNAYTSVISQCSPCPANSTGTNGSCSCNSGFSAIDKTISTGMGTTSILSYCQACTNPVPDNARRTGSCTSIKCNDGYYATAYRKYTYPDSNAYTTVISECSPCPPNSTGKNGSCSCNSGYSAIDKIINTGWGTTSILSYCQACSNPVPDNARRTGSCTSIQCNDGYYATAYRKYKYPDSNTYTSVISQCSPCPANASGKYGYCSCNSGYSAVYKTISTGTGTRSILSSCKKR